MEASVRIVIALDGRPRTLDRVVATISARGAVIESLRFDRRSDLVDLSVSGRQDRIRRLPHHLEALVGVVQIAAWADASAA